MPSKLTLYKLAENLIQESSAPFTADDFEIKIQEKWQREIPTSILKQLTKKLSNHHHIIGTDSNDFLPVPVVLKKIENLSRHVILCGVLHFGHTCKLLNKSSL